jgi:hypothetical protein
MRLSTVVCLAAAVIAGLFATLALAAAQTPAPACLRMNGPGESGVYVNLSDSESPAAIAHILTAVATGQPRILHWDPADADAHRRVSLRGIATAPGMDRDEYPPAASAEGGAGANVRLIPASDNRRAGARMGAVMRPFCPGQAFILEP